MTPPQDQRSASRASNRELVFESFGVVAAVSAGSAQALAEVETVLPPGWCAHAGEPSVRFELDGSGRVRQDGVEYFHAQVGRDEPLARLAALVRHKLAELAPDHAFIHAGVVVVGGSAVVVPGTSQSGKTTLVRALIERGALYASDEYAVVDRNGLIHPYPKPLTVRIAGVSRLGVPVPTPPERTLATPVTAGLVLITSYKPGGAWEPVERSAAEGAIALLENTVGARPRPAQSLAAVGALTRTARVLVGHRGEADETADALLAWLESEPTSRTGKA